MTDPNYTAVALLIDVSGSMEAIRVVAEKAINDFIAEQSKAVSAGARRTVRIAVFSDHGAALSRGRQLPDLILPSTSADRVERFTLVPQAGTALIDAMHRDIEAFGAELAALPETERPGTVVFAVMTDGLENSSKFHTYDQVAESVRRQIEEYGWQVLYLGANQDAIAEGRKLGVPSASSMTYDPTDYGTRVVGETLVSAAAAAPGERYQISTELRTNASRKAR